MKHIKLKEILENKLDTKQFIKEISAGAGLDDILSGKTTSIEGVKISKALADNIQSWIKLSPYGKKYGSFISKSKIQYLIKTANNWGINRYLDSNTKNEWSVISAKNEGTKVSIKEAVNVNYWKGYHERSTKITGGNKVASAVENEVINWNKNNTDGPSNNISSNGERKVMNLAHDFFKSAGWISSDIIQAMITQEG